MNADQREALKAPVEHEPRPAAYGVMRWRLGDLAQILCSPMAHHLEEISATVAQGAHAVLLLDRAGWHTTKKLPVTSNITLLLILGHSPEFNPVENLWEFLRDNWLGNRIFHSYANILDHRCDASNKLIAQPWGIMSIGLRRRTHGF